MTKGPKEMGIRTINIRDYDNVKEYIIFKNEGI